MSGLSSFQALCVLCSAFFRPAWRRCGGHWLHLYEQHSGQSTTAGCSSGGIRVGHPVPHQQRAAQAWWPPQVRARLLQRGCQITSQQWPVTGGALSRETRQQARPGAGRHITVQDMEQGDTSLCKTWSRETHHCTRHYGPGRHITVQDMDWGDTSLCKTWTGETHQWAIHWLADISLDSTLIGETTSAGNTQIRETH